MDIGHSRLLKFLVKEPKMEKHTLKIKDLRPSDIESEVPRQQKLREASKPTVETKPRLETVQNTGQIEWVDLRDMVKKPIHMGLEEEVIRSPHQIRAPSEHEPTIGKTDNTTPGDSKPQTRIPVSRFKPAAERVLKEKRDANAQKSKREAPEKPRRTSIPKLKDRIPVAKKNPPTDEGRPAKTESVPVKEAKEETPVKTILKRATRQDRIPVLGKDHYKITKKDDAVKKDEPVKTDSIKKLNDEFDKLYDEIVDNDAASLSEEILEVKVKDPEKLEIKFEEIVHQYDDPPIEQVKLEPIDKARYSKIPLFRRRSSHDVKLPRKLERRLSLKTGTINKSTLVGDQDANNSTVKIKDIDKAHDVTEKNRLQLSDNADSENAVELNNNDENNEDRYLGMESPPLIPDHNTIPTPDSELVKVGIFGISTRNIPFEEKNQNVTTPELETVKVAVIDIPAEEPPKYNSEDIRLKQTKPTHPSQIQDNMYIPTIDKKHNIVDNVYLSEENNTDVPNNSAEETFTKDEEDSIKVAITNDDPADHNKINRIVYPDNDLKSYNLLKNTSNVKEITKSEYINKPPKEESKPNNVAKLEEDIPKGKVSRILKRLTSQESPTTECTDNNFNKEVIDAKKEKDDIPKKKSVLSKIAMLESPTTEYTDNNFDKEVIDAKKEKDNIPKKKSLLSKIAMFEVRYEKYYRLNLNLLKRGDPGPPKPNTSHKYSKPVRTISEDVKHSPKIVQEVLKPRGVQTDKHTIVTVDIVRPVEVITNNEEEVPVVENLKENIVTYDNFDDARLNKTENKIVHDVLPPKDVHTNEHTTVEIDVMKPVKVVDNNEGQTTFVENLKENTVTYDNFDDARLNKTKNKIIHDVLPPKDVHTNEHTTVEIDVMKPVKVVDNNEEKVTVVENLKKNTVTYDNFDDARLNKTENKIVHDVLPPKDVHTNEHTTVKIDVMKLVKFVDNNEEQTTVVENLKENTVNYDNFDDARLNKTKNKIVHDVLPPKDVHTNEHTTVKIDVMKPVKVVDNNEELTTVVENLKENTVTYDNFDDARLNKTENKIVHDVLPPKDVHTNEHTTVEIDVMKPVKVVDNNEEQVTVVENLKENTVTYDNFDDARLNKTENKIVHDVLPPKDVHTNEHTTVEIDVVKPVKVVDNNEEQVTVVENLKENTVTYDNFDHDRLNNIEPTEIEPKSTVLADISGKDDNYNKSERSDNSEGDLKIEKENKPKGQFLKDDDNNRPAPINKIKANNYHSKEKWKSTDALADFLPVKEKIKRLKSYEDTNMKRAKSTAELDLGDAVKGKVKKMIVRMNSSELLDDVRPREVEVISEKERPRKRSVSEKIALFERKLTPVTMDNVKLENTGRALNPHTKPVSTANAVPVNTKPVNTANAVPVNVTTNGMQIEADIDYAAKIKELKNAKITYGSVTNMSYIQLRDGRKMPVIALGTALLDPKLATHIVSAAIDLGYRAIDTAFIYGNEKEVGEGIRAKILDGSVRREELFIMNKMWSTFHRPDLVEGACRASLAATGLDYFDLYMIHNPMSFKEGGDPLPKIANVLQFSDYDYLDAWFAMENLVSKGLVRSIGVSNFNSVQLLRVLDKGRIKPVVNQVECHPYLSQQRLSEFCEARDVRMSCFGVLGSKGTPADLKASQAAAIDDPLVQVMAAGLGISPAQLLIRYQIDSGHGVVAKASSGAHLRDNLRALRAALQPPQRAAIHALNKNKRTFTFAGMGDTHRNYPFKIAF
ncbi:uncharacterized protein LOC134752511 [Cydia strobilella]|uniref:uncharacterized protein LOC134752511 n=1 Tax=Cydia strobilella TaxID=1100964 RepID=UPI0030045A80